MIARCCHIFELHGRPLVQCPEPAEFRAYNTTPSASSDDYTEACREHLGRVLLPLDGTPTTSWTLEVLT